MAWRMMNGESDPCYFEFLAIAHFSNELWLKELRDPKVSHNLRALSSWRQRSPRVLQENSIRGVYQGRNPVVVGKGNNRKGVIEVAMGNQSGNRLEIMSIDCTSNEIQHGWSVADAWIDYEAFVRPRRSNNPAIGREIGSHDVFDQHKYPTFPYEWVQGTFNPRSTLPRWTHNGNSPIRASHAQLKRSNHGNQSNRISRFSRPITFAR